MFERMTSGMTFSDKNEFYFESVNGDPKNSRQMTTHHYHNFFEIYYLEKGECNYFVGGKTYTAYSGDVILIPENVIHKTTYFVPYSRSVLYFTKHFIPTSVVKVLPDMIYLYRNSDIKGDISEIFSKIKKEYENPDLFTEDALRALVHTLFFLFARNENEVQEKNSSLIGEVVKYIGDNFSHNITLTDTAKIFSISPEHLSRTFKKETGFGFLEYSNLVRLQKAEQILLSDRKKTVSEIAFSSGFSDSNYFSDKFKRTYGLSPLKYRNKK